MSRFKGMKRKPHTDKVVLEDNEPQSEQATWARTQDRKTQVVRFGLFGAIGAGVLALVLVLSGFTASSPNCGETEVDRFREHCSTGTGGRPRATVCCDVASSETWCRKGTHSIRPGGRNQAPIGSALRRQRRPSCQR